MICIGNTIRKSNLKSGVIHTEVPLFWYRKGGCMETLLKVSYFLNNRQVRKDGSIPIYMKISNSNRVVHISTGMTNHEGQWNKNTRQFMGNTPEVKSKNESLKLLELKIWKTVNGLIQKGTPFTLETIQNEMKHKNNEHPTILSVMKSMLPAYFLRCST